MVNTYDLFNNYWFRLQQWVNIVDRLDGQSITGKLQKEVSMGSYP
jgi:hypothetical protein